MTSATIIYILSVIGSITRESVYPYTNTNQTVQNAYNRLLECNGKSIKVNDIRILDKHIISVDGELFNVYRPKGWTRHDVRHIGNAADRY